MNGMNAADLPVWSVLPFAGMLFSIALGPLLGPRWWHARRGLVSAGWSFLAIGMLLEHRGGSAALEAVLHVAVYEYLPFICLLGALFVVCGGIHIQGEAAATPRFNGLLIAVGTLLASWIGTLGASLLFIRPLLRALRHRRYKTHTIIFFIFLVCNIGGALTPVGDPPLFLGYLHGVPFFWTLRLLPITVFNGVVLWSVYLTLDGWLYRREIKAGGHRPVGPEPGSKWRLEGKGNLVLLVLVLAVIISSGAAAQAGWLSGGLRIWLGESAGMVLPWVNLLREGSLVILAGVSWRLTPKTIHCSNQFSWEPIREVAVLFGGIFISMIPALEVLQTRAAAIGVVDPAGFFWATGVLSSMLDNAPTYLAFLSVASGLGTSAGVPTDLGLIDPALLAAVSCGAVFMGALTYIGNAPNFIVRAMAEQNSVPMPGFFAYLGWSLGILGPLFVLNTILFFL